MVQQLRVKPAVQARGAEAAPSAPRNWEHARERPVARRPMSARTRAARLFSSVAACLIPHVCKGRPSLVQSSKPLRTRHHRLRGPTYVRTANRPRAHKARKRGALAERRSVLIIMPHRGGKGVLLDSSIRRGDLRRSQGDVLEAGLHWALVLMERQSRSPGPCSFFPLVGGALRSGGWSGAPSTNGGSPRPQGGKDWIRQVLGSSHRSIGGKVLWHSLETSTSATAKADLVAMRSRFQGHGIEPMAHWRRFCSAPT